MFAQGIFILVIYFLYGKTKKYKGELFKFCPFLCLLADFSPAYEVLFFHQFNSVGVISMISCLCDLW